MTCTLDEVVETLRNYGELDASRFTGLVLSYAMIFMYYLGLRPSECYALHKSDIDLENRTISISKAAGSTSEDKLTYKKTKNNTSTRTIPFPSKLYPYIEELYKIQEGDALFTDINGNIISPNAVGTFVHNAIGKANLNFRPYMLRHNFSTDMIENDVDVRTVMELMGHSSGSMTVDYASSNDKLKREAIENGDKAGIK